MDKYSQCNYDIFKCFLNLLCNVRHVLTLTYWSITISVYRVIRYWLGHLKSMESYNGEYLFYFSFIIILRAFIFLLFPIHVYEIKRNSGEDFPIYAKPNFEKSGERNTHCNDNLLVVCEHKAQILGHRPLL